MANSGSTAATAVRASAASAETGAAERRTSVISLVGRCIWASKTSGRAATPRPSCFSSPTTPMMVVQRGSPFPFE
jgi:hypothetical protein